MTVRLYTAAEVRALDRAAIEVLGIAGYVLMQRAAAAAWRTLRARWPQARRVVVCCGPGNNGGDAARARADWLAHGGRIGAAQDPLPDADVHVDALFGTGLARPIEGAARQLIERLRESATRVLALDVPSGIDADTGNVLGVAVPATATISFVAHKCGLFTGPALEHRGDLVLDTLALPEELY